MAAPTHYEILGVVPTATRDDIRRAYREMARRYHPDARAGAADPDRGAAMAAINAAWHVLRDPARRRSYDAEVGLRRTTQTAGGATKAGGEPGDDPAEAVRFDIYAGFGEEDERARPARAADLLVMVPVLLVLAAVGMFFFSTMSGATGLRTFALVLLPVSGVGFVAAPLVVMLRARSRDIGR